MTVSSDSFSSRAIATALSRDSTSTSFSTVPNSRSAQRSRRLSRKGSKPMLAANSRCPVDFSGSAARRSASTSIPRVASALSSPNVVMGLRLASGRGRLQSLFGVVHSRRKACTICTNGLDDALPKVPYRNATSPTGRRNFREWRVSGAVAMSSHARTAAMRCSSLEDW